MGRRDWSGVVGARKHVAWVVGTALVLLLAAWVSGAGTITAFAPNVGQPSPTKTVGELIEQDQTDNASQGGPTSTPADGNHFVTTTVVWTLRVLLVLIVLTVLFVVVRAIVRRLRRDPVIPKDAVRAGLLPDVLASGLRDIEGELDRGTSSEAVINAWLALERTATSIGIDDDVARTPAEFVAEVLGGFHVGPEAIERLAALYREARFSEHPIGEEQREAARQALRRVRADLPEALHPADHGVRP